MDVEKRSHSLKSLWQERNTAGTVAARLWELFKFCVAGGVGFLVEFSLFYLLATLWGVHYLIANAIAFTLSVVINYLICAFWVFPGANRESKLAMAAFLVTSLIGLGLNELLMLFFVGALGMQSDAQMMFAKVMTAILVMIWNYFSKRKVLTYKHKKNGADAAPDPENLPS